MAWTARAGRHTFVVPGEHQAPALVDAFVAFGYPLVTAGPHDMSRFVPECDRDQSVTDWTVTVVDEGPYAMDAQGSREWTAVSRSARRLAREHRGYFWSGMEFDVSRLAEMGPGRDVLTRRNPGSRPARPAARPSAAALTHARLTLECEPPQGGGVDLGELREVPWASLEHAYGQAEDVPEFIQGLARNDGEWGDLHAELIGGMVLHQGSCYPATSPVIPFLARLICSDAFAAERRAGLYMDLLYAATRHGSSLLTDADRAAARDRRPSPAPWALDVRDAVKAVTPALLARWEREPSLIKVVLASLAGLFPEHGVVLRDEIRQLAQRYPGSGVAVFSDLLVALADGDAPRIGRPAALMVDGLGGVDPDDLDAPQLPIEIRVTNILWEACLSIAA
jgi:hypothetical protein